MTSRTEHNDPRTVGGFFLTYHYEMLSDNKRVTPFHTALKSVCPGKVVFESGTGSGVLAILAARAGASRVFCSEIDPNVAKFARANFSRIDLGDKITLIPKSTLEVTISDLDGLRPDVVMAENLSTWQVTEPQNFVMNYVRKNLASSSSVSIPRRAFNMLQICDAEFTFFDAVELRTHFFEFTGIRLAIQRSAPTLACIYDYADVTAESVNVSVELEAWNSGRVNAIRFTSPLELSEGNYFDASDSLMPPVVVPLEKDLQVRAGQRVKIGVQFRTNTRWEDVSCNAEVR